MDLPRGLDQALLPLMPHLWPLALCAARLLPICLMCPLFGGAQAPMQVRLSVASMLALFIHFGCGVGLPAFAIDAGILVPAFLTQLLAGVASGYVAGLPFHAARIGGRLLDTFRGATSESRLAEDVDKDSATAGLLHPLLVAMLCAGPGHRLFIRAVVKGFVTLPLAGSGPALETIVERCAAGALAVMATGLAIGAPVAALSLLVDVGLGIAARAGPQLRLSDIAPPVKLALGMGMILLALGAVSGRLLDVAAEQVESLQSLQQPRGN